MSVVENLMAEFAARGRRHLWTDAFAVCNYVALGDLVHAKELVDKVHATLAHARTGGWLPGASEQQPTRGGLRTGGSDEDVQEFHHLTRWMHALERLGRASGDARYGSWARDLAEVAHRAFVHGRLHDPLDGYATARELGLDKIAESYRALVSMDALATTEPLGIGGMLVDAFRLARLGSDVPLRTVLLRDARIGLLAYLRRGELRRPVDARIPCRELGLAIGLAAAGRLGAPGFPSELGPELIAFWSQQRDLDTYRAHVDINDVMLATAILPDGYLDASSASETSNNRRSSAA